MYTESGTAFPPPPHALHFIQPVWWQLGHPTSPSDHRVHKQGSKPVPWHLGQTSRFSIPWFCSGASNCCPRRTRPMKTVMEGTKEAMDWTIGVAESVRTPLSTPRLQVTPKRLDIEWYRVFRILTVVGIRVRKRLDLGAIEKIGIGETDAKDTNERCIFILPSGNGTLAKRHGSRKTRQAMKNELGTDGTVNCDD